MPPKRRLGTRSDLLCFACWEAELLFRIHILSERRRLWSEGLLLRSLPQQPSPSRRRAYLRAAVLAVAAFMAAVFTVAVFMAAVFMAEAGTEDLVLL
jgi:hypothetical protein